MKFIICVIFKEDNAYWKSQNKHHGPFKLVNENKTNLIFYKGIA